MPMTLPEEPRVLRSLSTTPQLLGMSTYTTSGCAATACATSGEGSGVVGGMPIVLTLVIPAAFITGGITPSPATLPCELSKYRTAALLAPSVLAAYTEAAALSPRLIDHDR